jgi:FkbM family methyltransferase
VRARAANLIFAEGRRARLRAELARALLSGRPLSVVDVGALWGLQPELAEIAEHVEAIGFDPDADECARLNERARAAGLAQRFLPYAVAGTDGPRTFYLYRKAASSSLLRPNLEFHSRYPEAERMDVVETIDVQARSLGGLLAELGVRPEFMKLDSNGIEGEILGSLLPDQCEGLLGAYVEVLLSPQYVGQSTVASIHDRLLEQGLELFQLRRYCARRAGFDVHRHLSRGQVTFADTLYLRKAEGLDAPRRERLALIAAAFDHYDYALDLLRAAGNDEAERLVEGLSRRRSRVVRAFAARLNRIGRLGRRLDGLPASPWTGDPPQDWI